MQIKFFKDGKKLTGDLKYYYNGYFTIAVEKDGCYGVCYVSEEQLEKPANKITNNFTVETNGRYNLYNTNKFELAEAYASGYNDCLDTKNENEIAKVFFEEKI